MEKVWEHMFNHELKIDPTDGYTIFLTEHVLNPKWNKEMMAEVRSCA